MTSDWKKTRFQLSLIVYEPTPNDRTAVVGGLWTKMNLFFCEFKKKKANMSENPGNQNASVPIIGQLL